MATSRKKVTTSPPSVDELAAKAANNGHAASADKTTRPKRLPPDFHPRPKRPTQADAPDLVTARTLDRAVNAAVGRATGGLSPIALQLAYLDWAAHLTLQPAKQAQLASKAARKIIRMVTSTARTLGQQEPEPCIDPLPGDHRFTHEDWAKPPYTYWKQAFLLTQQWWWNATHGVRGVSRHSEDLVSFLSRQVLDMFAPSNYLALNPEAQKKTLESGGQNLVNGFQHFVEDMEHMLGGRGQQPDPQHAPGIGTALTEGRVVYRNHVMELIQYAPQTDRVHAEPILITPAWIMKYYILDLEPRNSLIKYLVEQGHTVFVISWKNPTEVDRNLDLHDYRRAGVQAALDLVNTIVPDRKVHLTGYCLGGTLASVVAAAMARDNMDRLASLTLLAAQTDFSEPGELALFIDERQVSFLEDVMWDQGFLDTHQMAGAFQLLRSADLIWSQITRSYMMGERLNGSSLMAWNADATRMPYHMHSQYLRSFYLNNELARGRFEVRGRPIALSDIEIPMFVVGTETDHVAPWQSVYKIHLLTNAEVTFCLTNGGHNAGIVSQIGHPRRHHRIHTRHQGDDYIDPDAWLTRAATHKGSWWEAWAGWLGTRSTEMAPPPSMGKAEAGLRPMDEAPGTYVLMP